MNENRQMSELVVLMKQRRRILFEGARERKMYTGGPGDRTESMLSRAKSYLY